MSDTATIAPDTADTSAVSTMVAPEASPLTEAKKNALSKHFTPAQLAALEKTKTDEAATAQVEAPTKPARTPKAKAPKAEAPVEVSAPPATEDVVVDFSTAHEDEETETDTEAADPAATTEEAPTALTDDELKGLDAKARKAYLDASKEAAKVRKRAQDAESKVNDLEARLADIESKATRSGDQLPAELNSTNSLAHVQDDKTLDAYERDAKNVLRLLQAAANGDDIDSRYTSLVDGKVYEIDHTYAAWAAGTIVDVEGRRKQLTATAATQAKASKLEARLKDTPGFADALKSVNGKNLLTEWPQRRVEAAIGSLVTSGQYRLIKISSGKAAGATSPASVTAPTPQKAAPTAATPRSEPKGTMPAGSPAGSSGVSPARLSQLEQQATKTGHPDDVKALMKAKMEFRRAQRSGA